MVQALEIRDSLPKTRVGKISKKDLYDEEERKTAAEAFRSSEGTVERRCCAFSQAAFDAIADQVCSGSFGPS
jgi:hypothetical protein